MAGHSPPTPLRTLQRAQIRGVGTVFLRMRPVIVAPPVLLSWILLWPRAPTMQSAVVTALTGTMLSVFAIESWALRRREVDERWLYRSLVLTLVALLCASLVTGGLQSPYVPLLFAPAVTAFAAWGRAPASAWMLGGLVVGVVALGLAPESVPFPPLPAALRGPMTAVTVILAAVLLRVSVARLSDAHAAAGASLDHLRRELLAGAEGRAAAVESIGAKVAHEIRNPLTAIRGLVDLLAGGATDERGRRRFEVVQSEIARIEGIVRDYLGFARPLAALRLQPVALAGVARDVVDILDARAHETGVRIDLDAAPVVVSADPQRLVEALLNLVGNALEASAAGGRVVVGVGVDERGAPRITIADDGRGMGPEQLARLGTPYASDRPGGTGLGVVLAKQAIAQHGGMVEFTSTRGVGTTVTITLPPTEGSG